MNFIYPEHVHMTLIGRWISYGFAICKCENNLLESQCKTFTDITKFCFIQFLDHRQEILIHSADPQSRPVVITTGGIMGLVERIIKVTCFVFDVVSWIKCLHIVSPSLCHQIGHDYSLSSRKRELKMLLTIFLPVVPVICRHILSYMYF